MRTHLRAPHHRCSSSVTSLPEHRQDRDETEGQEVQAHMAEQVRQSIVRVNALDGTYVRLPGGGPRLLVVPVDVADTYRIYPVDDTHPEEVITIELVEQGALQDKGSDEAESPRCRLCWLVGGRDHGFLHVQHKELFGEQDDR